MEGLNFENNILGEQEIENLFMAPDDTTSEETENGGNEETQEPKENDEKKQTAEVVDPEDLFEDEQPESVGSEKNKDEGDTATVEGDGTSPNNFYSSIANALAVDGIFPNLDEDAVKQANDPESFSKLIEDEINARFDQKQQRILKALENGVEASDIRKYENTLQFISTLTEAAIREESDKGEQLRRNLIYQDFLNKGISPEKAQKFTERTIDAGNDVEDALEALQSNREYFQGKYNELLAEAQKEADREKAERAKQTEKLKSDILKDKTLMGDLDIAQDIRKKAFENISTPVYRDPESGAYLTALQRYEMEHRAEFLKYTGLFFTLTNGFKDFDSFTKGKVKKEVRKGLRDLERSLNNTRRGNNGDLRMVTSASDDPESFISKGFKLDL